MEKEFVNISKDKLYMAVRLIKEVRDKHPNKKYRLRLMHHKQLIEQLLNDEFDNYIETLMKVKNK